MTALNNVYALNSVVRITATFAVSGSATDPTAITMKVKNPAGTVATYTYALSEITKSATGIYYKDVSVTSSGTWYYSMTGTGTCAAAAEGKVFVRPTDLS